MEIALLLPVGFILVFSLLTCESRGFLGSAWSPLSFGVLVVLTRWVSFATFDVVPLAFSAFLAFVRAGPTLPLDGARRILESRFAPLLFGFATAGLVTLVWGSWHGIPAVHDEAAYLLQARLFSEGRWAAPAPLLPEFFEQLHVLVVPVYAAKYPPGHAILLAPGVRFGIPGAVPVLLSGLAGSLLFGLSRKLANGWVAVLAWLLWTTAPGNLRFQPTYLSELTTTVLWMLGWSALLAWRRSRRTAWILTLALCVGWGAITRPLTMLVFAFPAGAVVLLDSARRRQWRPVVMAAVVGVLPLTLIPLWSARTTGDWRLTPLSLYTTTYMPYDTLGFGGEFPKPRRSLPPDLARVNEHFARVRAHHTADRLQTILGERLRAMAGDIWGGWRTFLLLFAAIGVIRSTREVKFAVATSLLLVGAYLLYWHLSTWSVYYLETYPTAAFVTALGLWLVVSGLPPARAELREAQFSGRAAFAMIVAAFVLSGPASVDVQHKIWSKRQDTAGQRRFADCLETITDRRAIVFVRYGRDHDDHRSLVRNDPALPSARCWVVYDRGAENGALMRIERERAPFLYDEERQSLARLEGRAEAVNSLPGRKN